MSNQTLFVFNKLNKHADFKGQYLADPATCLASNSVRGTLFSSENS